LRQEKSGPSTNEKKHLRFDEGEWDIKDNKYRVFIQGEWIVVPDHAVISGPNKFGKAIVWFIGSWEGNDAISRIRCFIPGSGV
jgi:hypothetical protein